MKFFEKASGFITKTVNTARSGVKKVSSAAKSAVEALTWMADKSEQFVGDVKALWGKAKPYVEKFAPKIVAGLKLVPHPWAQAAALAIEKTARSLLALENSEVMRAAEKAILWAANRFRELGEYVLNVQELCDAAQRRVDLAEAYALAKLDEVKQAIRLAQLINDFEFIKSETQRLITSGEVQGFEHYLRMRAAQKLLNAIESRLRAAQSVVDLTEDDVFLIGVGADLVSENPQLSDEHAARLDEIIQTRYGKTLSVFVFEELVATWEAKYEAVDVELSETNQLAAEAQVRVSNLDFLERSSSEEELRLLQERDQLVDLESKQVKLKRESMSLKHYVHAAEGLLQVIEKSPEQLEAEGIDYILDFAEEVGTILIDCAQHGRNWESLSAEEKNLIINYANVFRQESKRRLENLKLVEVHVA